VINDISGGLLDKDILTVAKRYQVPIILMHMRGYGACVALGKWILANLAQRQRLAFLNFFIFAAHRRP